MQPFKLRLLYLGRHWLTVPFELGYDEIGSTQWHDLRISPDIVDLFATIGLDEPQPIPLLTVEHLIAQKLHATSVRHQTGSNDRAHDLVNLQILEQEEPINRPALASIANRLFRARWEQTWPPVVTAHPGWPPSTLRPPTDSTCEPMLMPQSSGRTISSPHSHQTEYEDSVPSSCLEERETGCNQAQHRATQKLAETDSDQANHPIRRHDAFSLEALPKLITRVRFPSSAPQNTWS